jgi:hypothetical protein
MAARQPLELIILVRIQAPQPEFPACKRGFLLPNGPRATPLAAQALFVNGCLVNTWIKILFFYYFDFDKLIESHDKL